MSYYNYYYRRPQFNESASSVKVKRLNQARVNGGGNDDSLLNE